jgi:hypothetical protein
MPHKRTGKCAKMGIANWIADFYVPRRRGLWRGAGAPPISIAQADARPLNIAGSRYTHTATIIGCEEGSECV